MGDLYRVPSSYALLGGFAIGTRVALLWQHNANAKCQRVLVLALRLVSFSDTSGDGPCRVELSGARRSPSSRCQLSSSDGAAERLQLETAAAQAAC